MSALEEDLDFFVPGTHKPYPLDAYRTSEHGQALRAARKSNAVRKERVSAKWQAIAALKMRGHTNKEIAARLGLNSNGVTMICTTDKFRAHLAARMADLDQDLIAMKPLALTALSTGLVSNEERTALSAAKLYFEMMGQGTFGRSGPPVASAPAEDVARALFNQARVEVNVHVSSPTPEVKYVDQSSPLRGQTPDGASLVTADEPRAGLPPGPPEDLRRDQPSGDSDSGSHPEVQFAEREPDCPASSQQQVPLGHPSDLGGSRRRPDCY